MISAREAYSRTYNRRMFATSQTMLEVEVQLFKAMMNGNYEAEIEDWNAAIVVELEMYDYKVDIPFKTDGDARVYDRSLPLRVSWGNKF